MIGVITLTLLLASPWITPYAARAINKLKRDYDLPLPTPPAPKTVTVKVKEKPEPLSEKFFPDQRVEMQRLYNGMQLALEFDSREGGIASEIRNKSDSFKLTAKLDIKVPKPNQSLDDLKTINPHLPTVLPGLKEMMETAQVSPFYHELYKRKRNFTVQYIKVFSRLLSRHNFYDCDTILELKSKDTGRKALLIQAEMDVVTDGSDADRTLVYDDTSRWFQPFTSYGWRKRTDTPNPFIAQNLKKIEELQSSGASASTIRRLKRNNTYLKNSSYLVAHMDPFIVVPGFMAKNKDNAFAPKVGDYAVVIYEDRIYPAIIGDTGPYIKAGEASLLICQKINPSSNGRKRPVNDLKVSYLVFPGTRDTPFGPPDLKKWQKRCEGFLDEIGGTTKALYDWSADPRTNPKTASLVPLKQEENAETSETPVTP